MIDFGVILRELRVENGLTQAKLAKKLGVAAPTVTSWESCVKYPSVDNLIQLSKLYSVPLNYLTGIEKERSIVLDDLSTPQQNLLKTLVLEFQNKSKNKSGLTDRQKDIISDLTAEFNK